VVWRSAGVHGGADGQRGDCVGIEHQSRHAVQACTPSRRRAQVNAYSGIGSASASSGGKQL
jgi:hypothetical protein